MLVGKAKLLGLYYSTLLAGRLSTSSRLTRLRRRNGLHAPAKIPAISSRKIQKNTTCYHAGNERYGAQEGWLCEELWVPNF